MEDVLFDNRPEIISEDIIEKLEGIEEKRDKWTIYNYNGINVPRVSEILKACIGKDYLVSYALKCKNYYAESNQVLYIGTIVHQMIDEFLQYGDVMTEIDFRNEEIFNRAEKAYNNFVRWYKDKKSKGYEIDVLGIEVPIVCPWYGGTIDAIFKITDPNGVESNYIVDFKTSSKIAIDYLIQTYSYMWAINWYNSFVDSTKYPHIDGIGIIRIDKKSKVSEDIFIHSSDTNTITNIHNGYVDCLNWYYHQLNLEWIIKQQRK